MNEEKDKPNQEIEKLETEIKRSLTVVGVKEAHKKIEDVERERKRAIILSIIDRISFCIQVNEAYLNGIAFAKKGFATDLLFKKLPDSPNSEMFNFVETFDSIRYDFKKNAELKDEDFDKLFPRPKLSFETVNQIELSLVSMCIQMKDMEKYCKRLL